MDLAGTDRLEAIGSKLYCITKQQNHFRWSDCMSVSKNEGYVHALRFEFLTPLYDAIVKVTTRERTFKNVLIEQAKIQDGFSVLDVACGTGTLAIWTKQKYPDAKVVGIDGDSKILALARGKAIKEDSAITFEQGLSYNLPFNDGSFDRVMSSLFFHHLNWNDKVRTARDMFRVLKPGGELHVADWGSPTSRIQRALFYQVQLLDGFENTSDNVQGKLTEVFADGGFDDVALTGEFSTVFGTMSLYKAVKSKE